MQPDIPKPRADYLGEQGGHPLEHGEDVLDAEHVDELVGSSPHVPPPDLRAEEPSGETGDGTELH